MSAQFRQKLVDSLASKSYAKYSKLIRMFDHGEVIIRRADWAITYNNALIKVFKDNNRFKVLVAGRRFGKSYLAAVILMYYSQIDRTLNYYIAPTYKMAK